MTIDHIGYAFPDSTPYYLRIVGRMAAPIFFFLLVESYHKTSNKKNYFNRIFLFSIIMWIGNNLLLSIINPNLANKLNLSSLQPNIFMSFSIGFLIMASIDTAIQTRHLTTKANLIFLTLVLIALSSITEYSYLGPFMVLTFHLFFKHNIIKKILFLIGSILIPLMLNNPIQTAMLTSFVFINEYNGNKGVCKTKPFSNKLFFYIYYPIHIWIFIIISNTFIHS